MAAKAQPIGSVPEKHGSYLDVKEDKTEAPSPSEKEVEAKTEEPEETPEPDLDETDLKEFEEESRKIPYSRFKEVNQKAKELEAKLQEREGRYEQSLRREIELAELRIKDQLKREYELAQEAESLDPQEREFRSIRKENNALREEIRALRRDTDSRLLGDQVSRLEKTYSKKVVLAALGLKKHDSSINLEEACEDFQAEVKEMANQKLRQLIDGKRAKAKTGIPTRESGIKLKESERPKTIAEAKAAFRKMFMAR